MGTVSWHTIRKSIPHELSHGNETAEPMPLILMSTHQRVHHSCDRLAARVVLINMSKIANLALAMVNESLQRSNIGSLGVAFCWSRA